ncbi:hypothetical protein BF49_3594 [Bradyrhizobium sp.]|uniref:hypothetical protein n=1 Tax=Bradyrhizobium sp. TaxID=376 RepID=UPI0007C18CA5|nr:hypothetical protein [Bradyrhizobium sp.]CUT12514.1 hypothetical protein BF49_3594 [Bradyrhizobium sp.]
MTSDVATELVGRCLAAHGPDRELDADIFFETGEFRRKRINSPEMLNREYVRRLGRVGGVPPFTSSIDAAVALLPAALFWLIGRGRDTRPEEPLGGAIIFAPGAIDTIFAEAEAQTVALAMCAAALLARAKVPA